MCQARSEGQYNGCPWEARSERDARWGVHLDVLNWARARGCPWDLWKRCDAAAEGGRREAWLRRHDYLWDVNISPMVCQSSPVRGHPEVLPWAREHDCPWDEDICQNAVGCGRARAWRGTARGPP
jgi:hypothetical protein